VKRLKEFLTEAGGWAVSSIFAGLASLSVSIYEHVTASPLAAYWFLFAAGVLFSAGCFIAWLSKARDLDNAMAQLERLPRPKVLMAWNTTPVQVGNLVYRRRIALKNAGEVDALKVQGSSKEDSIVWLKLSRPVDIAPGDFGSLDFQFMQRSGDRMSAVPGYGLGDQGIATALTVLRDLHEKPELQITIHYEDFEGKKYRSVCRLLLKDGQLAFEHVPSLVHTARAE
jgi:hypothetical protein